MSEFCMDFWIFACFTRLVQVDTPRRCPCFFLQPGRRLLEGPNSSESQNLVFLEIALARFKQSPCYSEAQFAQRQETRLRLADLHRTTERELQRVSNSYLTMPQYAAAGETLTTLARRIKSLVQRRAQIRLVALAENSVTPTVVIGTVCDHCYGLDEDPSAEAVESENPDAEVIIAIDRLLELVQQTEERVAGRCRNLPLPAKFFTGVAALKRALLHEQSQLLRTTSRLQGINVVEDDSKFCERCGRPYAPELSDTGNTDERACNKDEQNN